MESAFRTLTWASAVCTVASRPSLSHLRRPCCAALAAALAVAEFLWLRRHQFASGRLRLRDEGAQGGYEGLGRRVGLMSPLCAPPPFLFSRPTCRRRLFRGPCTSGAVAEESLGSLKPLRMCPCAGRRCTSVVLGTNSRPTRLEVGTVSIGRQKA